MYTLTPFPAAVARHASGSRNAISIGCVSNVVSMTCAALASAASTSPRENAVDRLQDVRRPRAEGVRWMHERRSRLHRLEWIGERLEDLVVDPDLRRGLPRVELRVGDDHREEVGHAAGELAFGDEDRLVGIVEALSAEAGHVRRGEDADDAGHCRGLVDVNLQDPRARMLGQHHRAVQHARDAHVVDELLVAERLLGAAESRDRMADAVDRPVAVPVRERRVSRSARTVRRRTSGARLGAREPIAACAASPPSEWRR